MAVTFILRLGPLLQAGGEGPSSWLAGVEVGLRGRFPCSLLPSASSLGKEPQGAWQGHLQVWAPTFVDGTCKFTG